MKSFSERLKSAVIMKSYSIDDLAKVLHDTITRDNLNKYWEGLLLNRLREQTIDALERYFELEELLGIKETQIKVIELEATPAFTCVAVWNEKRYPVSVIKADPHQKSTRFKQLLYRALDEEVISMSKAAALCNMKFAAFRNEALYHD